MCWTDPRGRRRAPGEAGLGSLEALLLLVLTAALLFGLLYLMLGLRNARQQVGVDGEDALQVALTALERALGEAGQGLGDCSGAAIWRWSGAASGAVADKLPLVAVHHGCERSGALPPAGCGGSDGVDAVTVSEGRGGQARLVRPMRFSWSPLAVTGGHDFRQGDLVALVHPAVTRCSLLRLSAAPRKVGGGWLLAHAADSGVNPPLGVELFPGGGYPVGARAVQLSSAALERHFAVRAGRGLVTWRTPAPGIRRAHRPPLRLETVAPGVTELRLALRCRRLGTRWQAGPCARPWAVEVTVVAQDQGTERRVQRTMVLHNLNASGGW